MLIDSESGSYLALCSYTPVNDIVDKTAISACRAYTVSKSSPLTQAHYIFNLSWDTQAPYSPVSVLIRKEIVMNMVNIPILEPFMLLSYMNTL